MVATVNIYSNKKGELNKFLSHFYNTDLDIENELKWEKKYENPIELAEIIGIYIDNSDNYMLNMWISLDKDVFINVTNDNANKIIKYLIAFIIPIYLIIYYLKIRTINKKIKELEKQNNNNIENNENEINKLKNQLNLLDNNSKIMEEQIEKEKNKNIYLLNIEKKKIFDKYSDIFNIEKINEIFNENDIDKKINILQTMIENSSNELTKLEIKQEEFEEQSSEIVRLEEEQEILGSQLKELKEKNDAIELVKETIEKAYEKLKENINPEFNKKLSENISKITNGKYNNILFNDEQGLIVELPNGNYVSADRLSIGTIDQIYLSLRLASIDEISNEKLPIILDEAFAYFDDIRLENIMLFLSKEFKDRQIIIFTCTTRELRILQNNNIEFNFIEL